jgi:hypothetical protein
MQYRHNEGVGRPFDSTVTGARMTGSGVFDRRPKPQVLKCAVRTEWRSARITVRCLAESESMSDRRGRASGPG